MKWLIMVVVGLFAALPTVLADDKTPVPAPVPAAPLTLTLKVGAPIAGRVVPVTAVTSGTTVKWKSPDAGLIFIPYQLTDSKTVLVIGEPATYRVYAVTSDASGPSEIAETPVTIPAPPTPPSQLVLDLQTAYTADSNAKKAQLKEDLTNLYAKTDTSDKTITTVGAMLTVLQAASKSLFSPSDLVAMRRVIAKELTATISTNASAPLTDALRATMRKEFDKIATSLSQVN